MVITGFVGKNPKESSSITASTISGYKALNYGKHHMNKYQNRSQTAAWIHVEKKQISPWLQCSHL